MDLSLIVRDEENALPKLWARVAGAFDEVALLDTGSTDAAIEVFQYWCRRTGQRHQIGHFEWVDDFAAARNAVQDLLSTDGVSWADADDTVIGARHLRRLAAAAGPNRRRVRLRLQAHDRGRPDAELPA